MATKSQFVETNCRVVKQQRKDRLKKVRKIPGNPMVEIPVRTWTIEKECWLVPRQVNESRLARLSGKEQLAIIKQETERLEDDEMATEAAEDSTSDAMVTAADDSKSKGKIVIRIGN